LNNTHESIQQTVKLHHLLFFITQKTEKSNTRNTIFWSHTNKKNNNSEKNTIKAQTKKTLPVRPPAPVTSTVLLALSAMATTPNSLVTLFTPSSFLFFAREKTPKEEEEERERERSLNEEDEIGRGRDGDNPQYLWH